MSYLRACGRFHDTDRGNGRIGLLVNATSDAERLAG